MIRWKTDEPSARKIEILPIRVNVPVTDNPRGILFVTAKTQEVVGSGDAPALLAMTTWDQRLIISSILDRQEVNKILRHARDELHRLDSHGARLFEMSSQVASLAATSTSPGPRNAKRQDVPSLRALGASDLVRIGTGVLQGLQTGAPAARLWLLEILKRAHELDAHERAEFYGWLSARLKKADSLQGAPDDIKRFWAAFRKWILYGPTYSDKRSGLAWLAYVNRDRELDALQYRTRLLRKRADTVWRFEPAANSGATRDVALLIMQRAAAGGPHRALALQSRRDGQIAAAWSEMQLHALDSSEWSRWPEQTFWTGSGFPARFRADTTVLAELGRHGLAISPDGTIERVGASEFSDVYHHGPYARRVVLLSTSQSGRLFALFAFRGWRRADVTHEEYRSSKGPRLCAIELRTSAADGAYTLEVVGATSVQLDDEMHALEILDAGPEGAALIGGCGGLRRSNETRTPFVRIGLSWQSALRVNVDPLPVDPEPRHSRSRVGAATALAEADWNPCAAIALARPVRAQGRLRLWAGFHDGQLIQYESETDGGWLIQRSQLLQARSSIWSLAASQNGRYVAYGTAGGTIGAIDALARRKFGTVLPMHVVHSHERAPVCSLGFVEDERERLVGLTQLGILSVHDVDAFELADDTAGRTPALRSPGYRVDRFSIEGSPRAMVVKPAENGRPLLLVGDADGGLRGLDLTFPRGSRRRTLAVGTCQELWRDTVRKLQATTTTDYGQREPLEWLRAVDVNGDQLFRFSLWSELDQFSEAKPQVFLAVLSRLREDAFHRRPFRHEPAKILWEEGARYAKRLSKKALRSGLAQDWNESLRMHKAVDDLCNRWIGQDHAIEAAVLAHSFKRLFNWSDIELLCSSDSARAAADLRTFVVFTMVERRLTFGGPIVPLEAVRTIVAALVASLSRMVLEGRPLAAASLADAAAGVSLYRSGTNRRRAGATPRGDTGTGRRPFH